MPLLRTKAGLDTATDETGKKLSLGAALRRAENADVPDFMAKSEEKTNSDPVLAAINQGKLAARQVVDMAVQNQQPAVPSGTVEQALTTGEVPVITPGQPRPPEGAAAVTGELPDLTLPVPDLEHHDGV